MKFRVRDAQAARRYRPICLIIYLMIRAPKKKLSGGPGLPRKNDNPGREEVI
jgi:hypothetical protein